MQRIYGLAAIRLLVIMVLIITVIAIYLPWIIQDQDDLTAEAKADINRISLAMTEFYKDQGFYPPAEQGLKALVEPSPLPPLRRNNLSKAYLSELPQDPWGRNYIYKNPGKHNPNTYDLYSEGPTGKPGGKVIGNW